MQVFSSKQEREIGFIRAAKQYLLRVEGLPRAHIHDIIVDEKGHRAIVTSLEGNDVVAMTLDAMDARPGKQVFLAPREHQFYMGEKLFGRAINSLGDPVDGGGGFPVKNASLFIDVEAPGISERTSITRQFATGFSLIDTVLPIGRGQRQLLMGPVRSGIDDFVREVILHQSDKKTVCIYAAIGRPATVVREFMTRLLEGPARDYTVILAAAAEDSTPQIAIAPSIAFLIAEHFRDEGHDVLLVLDDLYTHAKYLREVALLEGHLPGRESYPGDIFFQQAQLIERAGQFKKDTSITLLPILQTDIEGYADLITTNIMGTTDGHLSFNSSLYAQGMFPPVIAEESVTRVGKHTQSMVQKQLATAISSLMADARAQEKFTQFGAQVSDVTKQVLQNGAILEALLNQPTEKRYEPDAQAIVLGLVFTVFASGKDEAFFRKNKAKLFEAAATHKESDGLRAAVRTARDMQDFLKQLEAKSVFFEKVCQT